MAELEMTEKNEIRPCLKFVESEDLQGDNRPGDELIETSVSDMGNLKNLCVALLGKVDSLEKIMEYQLKRQAEFNAETYSAVSSCCMETNSIASALLSEGVVSEKMLEAAFSEEMKKYKNAVDKINEDKKETKPSECACGKEECSNDKKN
jgi:hypothetical protein